MLGGRGAVGLIPTPHARAGTGVAVRGIGPRGAVALGSAGNARSHVEIAHGGTPCALGVRRACDATSVARASGAISESAALLVGRAALAEIRAWIAHRCRGAAFVTDVALSAQPFGARGQHGIGALRVRVARRARRRDARSSNVPRCLVAALDVAERSARVVRAICVVAAEDRIVRVASGEQEQQHHDGRTEDPVRTSGRRSDHRSCDTPSG